MRKKLHQFILVLLALIIFVILARVALVAPPHFLPRIGQLDVAPSLWHWLIAWWQGLSQAEQGLVQLSAAVITGVCTIYLGWRTLNIMNRQHRKMDEASIPTIYPAFPFEQFSTDEIELLKKHRLGKHADIPYHPRFIFRRQESFERALDEQFLLLTGRRGLGKTRECIEQFIRIAKRKGEEVTILYPRGDFDRPREEDIPADFKPRTVILFIDEIEARCSSSPSKLKPKDSPVRTFNDRLTATIEWMSEQCAGRDWRVVLTAVDEAAYLERLQLDSAIWKDFRRLQLRGVHRDARPEFIRAVAEHFDLELDGPAVAHIAASSDGTPSGIIIPLAQESSRV